MVNTWKDFQYYHNFCFPEQTLTIGLQYPIHKKSLAYYNPGARIHPANENP